jgi:hypothetical protein
MHSDIVIHKQQLMSKGSTAVKDKSKLKTSPNFDIKSQQIKFPYNSCENKSLQLNRYYRNLKQSMDKTKRKIFDQQVESFISVNVRLFLLNLVISNIYIICLLSGELSYDISVKA